MSLDSSIHRWPAVFCLAQKMSGIKALKHRQLNLSAKDVDVEKITSFAIRVKREKLPPGNLATQLAPEQMMVGRLLIYYFPVEMISFLANMLIFLGGGVQTGPGAPVTLGLLQTQWKKTTEISRGWYLLLVSKWVEKLTCSKISLY